MEWYKHDISAYRRATSRLKLLAHGAYRLLMDEYYSGQGPLPEDYATLYRVCGAQTDHEKLVVRTVADQYFPVNGDGLRHNERCDAELAEYRNRVEKNRTNSRRRFDHPVERPMDKPMDKPMGGPVDHTDRHTIKDLEVSGNRKTDKNRTAGSDAARQALGLLVKRPAAQPQPDEEAIERNREIARKVVEEEARKAKQQLEQLDDNEPF